MVTVLRAEGLRVVIYVNDHVPAHVHVFGDGEAKINLIGLQGASDLVWASNVTHGEVRRSMRVVTASHRPVGVPAAEMGRHPWLNSPTPKSMPRWNVVERCNGTSPALLRRVTTGSPGG